MKAKALLLSAIILHFLVRIFWNFHIVIPEDTETSLQGTNIYMLGMSIVFLLWAYSYKERNSFSVTEKEKAQLKIITNFWLFFVTADVVKELSRTTGLFTGFFFNPTVPHIEEYVIWLAASGWLYYKLKK